MADKKCNPCTDNLFKSINSNPDLQDLIDLITEGIGGGSNTTVSGDDAFIFVEATTTGDITDYKVRYEPYIPLTLSLTDNVGLQLKGTTLSTFTLNWTYNKGVESQSLNQGLTAPAVVNGQKSYSLTPTGQSITTNTTITLTADDILGDDNNAKSDSVSITFGNYVYRTTITTNDRDNIDASVINGLTLDSLTKTLQTGRGLTFTAQSNATSYDVILMPTSYGLTSGTQFKDTSTNFTGGWGKLFDINLTNSAGFEESYGVWVASNKNLNGLTFQIS